MGTTIAAPAPFTPRACPKSWRRGGRVHPSPCGRGWRPAGAEAPAERRSRPRRGERHGWRESSRARVRAKHSIAALPNPHPQPLSRWERGATSSDLMDGVSTSSLLKAAAIPGRSPRAALQAYAQRERSTGHGARWMRRWEPWPPHTPFALSVAAQRRSRSAAAGWRGVSTSSLLKAAAIPGRSPRAALRAYAQRERCYRDKP